MKKVIAITLATIIAFVSCQKNPIEKTAAVDLAGQWYLIYNCVDANGDIVPGFEDFNGGYTLGLTFSTAANKADSIFVSDEAANLLGFQVKVPCNVADLTFGSEDSAPNIHPGKSTDIGDTAIIKNGKILRGAAKTPSGMPADSIYFEVKFADDAYAAYYGYDHYQAVGYRYTGFAADE